MRIKPLPNLPTLKSPQIDEQEENDFSILSPTVILFRRQDTFLSICHELHAGAANYDQTSQSLVKCLTALKHAYLISKWAIRKDERLMIDKLIREWIRKYNESYTEKNGLLKSDYTDLHQRIYAIMDRLYKAQQEVGMGIRKDHSTTTLNKMDKAMLE